jgi:hypothetical protein
MKFSMAAMRSLTEVKLPRRIAWRVMIEKRSVVRRGASAMIASRIRVQLSRNRALLTACAAVGRAGTGCRAGFPGPDVRLCLDLSFL